MTMVIDAASLWHFQTNTYVVAEHVGGPAVVVDAPPDVGGISDLLARHDLTPVAALVTHGHIDHVGGIDGVASGTVTVNMLAASNTFAVLAVSVSETAAR